MPGEQIKDRIVEFTRVSASDLIPNPKNWRTHPEHQRDGLKSILGEIGFADAVIARCLEDNSLMLIDGHLRAETAEDAMIPTLVVDVSEEEADLMLATLDPLASLAGTDVGNLTELMRGLSSENDQISVLLEDIRDNYSIDFHELMEQETDADFIAGNDGIGDEMNPNITGMKAVVLHLKEDEYEAFYEKAFELGDKWDMDNLSDVVIEAINRAHKE